jgi:hypothetical protein
MLLIQPSDIKTYRAISVNIPDDRIEPFILEAQRFDLRKITGKQLYEKLIENISPVNYPELKEKYQAFLSYRTYWRLLMHNQITITSAGVVYKTNEFSQVVPYEELSGAKKSALDGSKEYEQEFIEFMNENSELYPEWKNSDCYCHKSKVYGGVRIGVIGNKKTINQAANDILNNRDLYGNNYK